MSGARTQHMPHSCYVCLSRSPCLPLSVSLPACLPLTLTLSHSSGGCSCSTPFSNGPGTRCRRQRILVRCRGGAKPAHRHLSSSGARTGTQSVSQGVVTELAVRSLPAPTSPLLVRCVVKCAQPFFAADMRDASSELDRRRAEESDVDCVRVWWSRWWRRWPGRRGRGRYHGGGGGRWCHRPGCSLDCYAVGLPACGCGAGGSQARR